MSRNINTSRHPQIDNLPVCIVSTIAGFLNQRDFSAFVRLSYANFDAHLLPSHVTFYSTSKFDDYKKWDSTHRHITSAHPRVYFKFDYAVDAVLIQTILSRGSDMNIDKLEFNMINGSGNNINNRLIRFASETSPLAKLTIFVAFNCINHSTHVSLTLSDSGSLDHFDASICLITALTLSNNEHRLNSVQDISDLSCSNITILDLCMCYNLEAVSLLHFTHCPLTELSFRCGNLEDNDLVCLEQLSVTLIQLNLSDCDYLTDASLSHISNCHLITSLYMSGFELFTDAGISHIKRIPLTTLILSGEQYLTNSFMLQLSQFSRLKCLDLSFFTISDYYGFADMKTITTLKLDSVSMHYNTALRHINKQCHLSCLHLSNCNVNNDDISLLAFQPQLTELYISNCPNLTSLEYVRLFFTLQEFTWIK